MSRNLLFVLLVAMGVVLANNTGVAQAQAKAQDAQGPTKKAQAKTEAAPGRTELAQAKIEEGHGPAKKAQAKTETGQERTEPPAATMEEAPGQTDEAALPKEEPKLTSVRGGSALGMSILGNQEAPKSLVIVSWKALHSASSFSPRFPPSSSADFARPLT